MRPRRIGSPSTVLAACNGPERSRIRGRAWPPVAGTCSTTISAAGRFAGSALSRARRGWRPPAEAATTTSSTSASRSDGDMTSSCPSAPPLHLGQEGACGIPCLTVLGTQFAVPPGQPQVLLGIAETADRQQLVALRSGLVRRGGAHVCHRRPLLRLDSVCLGHLGAFPGALHVLEAGAFPQHRGAQLTVTLGQLLGSFAQLAYPYPGER